MPFMSAQEAFPERPISDVELIKSVRAGHPEVFAELVRRHQARVLRVCTSLLANATLAEDAAQEIFLKAYQHLQTFQAEAAFSTWLYRITANHCKDLLRKRSRERLDSWEALVEAEGERLQQLLTVSADPKTTVADAELVDRVLSHLPPNYRLILTLREVEGLSYQELAETLRCSLDAVKARLRRARNEFLEHLRHFSNPGAV